MPIARDTARVIIVDQSERVLLFGCTDPHDEYKTIWVLPGGGIEQGETPAQAAARELAEEAQVTVSTDALTAVATATGEWSSGTEQYLSTDHFFWYRASEVHIETFQLLPTESAEFRTWRWWASEELDHPPPEEKVFPSALASVVRAILTSGPPRRVMRLPW